MIWLNKRSVGYVNVSLLGGEINACWTNKYDETYPPIEEQKQVKEREYDPDKIFHARLDVMRYWYGFLAIFSAHPNKENILHSGEYNDGVTNVPEIIS